MTHQLDQFDFLSAEATNRPYLPFPLAVESGVLIDPEDMAKPLDSPAGVTLANGYIPNVREAGLVPDGDDIVAFDLVALDIEGADQVRISPVSKSHVASDGEIVEKGAVVMQNESGLLRFAGFAIKARERPWLADRLRQLSDRRHWQSVGGITVFSAYGLGIPDHEVTEVDTTTSSVVAKPRLKYF